MASAYVEKVLTGQWGPDQQTLTRWERTYGYDVRKVMRPGRTPLLQLHP